MLFNGGVFASPLDPPAAAGGAGGLVSRDAEPRVVGRPMVLDNDRLDLAVARGAAYYGTVRRGRGVRIAAGLARSYYIGVGAAIRRRPSAWCPAAAEPGQAIDLPERPFSCWCSSRSSFRLYVSSTRLTDSAGGVAAGGPRTDETAAADPHGAAARAGRRPAAVPVHLHARLTEIGTLELWCSEVGGGPQLAAAVRRPLGHPDRFAARDAAGEAPGRDRRGELGRLPRS